MNWKIHWIVLLLFLIHGNTVGMAQELTFVPKIASCELSKKGKTFVLPETISVACPDLADWDRHIRLVGELVNRQSNMSFLFDDSPNGTPKLVVSKDGSMAAEQYQISVANQGIEIRAASIKGLAHATATFLQWLGHAQQKGEAIHLPLLEIDDQPSFAYRSFMIDMGRNPHSLALLKQTVDLLWFYKVDSLHLHLTDDQLWSFPSKAYPKLQSSRAKITWEQFSELEDYARIRGVTLIPELEVPGHSTLLRRAYPEVFGKTPTDLAKSETAHAAIKVLLDEMIELFPSSPYIHIGGDEAYGVPVELQRSLINILHAHLKSKGKKTLVWEGPHRGTGDNKVNAEVIHLNWRTIDFPAREMVDAGHPVVNAAWDPLYLVDHYPRNNFTMASPDYIYANLNPVRFKHFNPGMPTFAKPETLPDAKGVIGFCMPWWEGREDNFWSMIVPRVIAMADVAWNVKQDRDVQEFNRRVKAAESIRQSIFHPVLITADRLVVPEDGVFHRSAQVRLDSNHLSANRMIRYTLDGTPPTGLSDQYQSPVELDQTTTIRAALFEGSNMIGHETRQKLTGVDPVANLALGKPVTTSATSGSPFSLGRLTDGGTENLDYYLGYPAEPEPIRITIDLGKATDISRIVVHHFHNNGPFESYRVEVSLDGQAFQQVADRSEKPETPTPNATHSFEKQKVRYVRIVTHGCKGNVFDSFSRITEVQVFAD